MMNSLAYNDMYTNVHNSYATRNDDTKAIKSAALRYLARREYSRLELYRKLSKNFSSIDCIQKVLDQLKEEGYQSDDRFAESYIRSRVSSGNGPFKIKIELREKGICESTSLAVFDRLSIDWFEVVSSIAKKRFGMNSNDYEEDSEPMDHQLIAKQVRYLKNKGFYQEHISKIFPR